jgi:hypothetical protein
MGVAHLSMLHSCWLSVRIKKFPVPLLLHIPEIYLQQWMPPSFGNIFKMLMQCFAQPIELTFRKKTSRCPAGGFVFMLLYVSRNATVTLNFLQLYKIFFKYTSNIKHESVSCVQTLAGNGSLWLIGPFPLLSSMT